MKKNRWMGYIKQVALLFSASVITVLLLAVFVGNTAQSYSSLFRLGQQGIGVFPAIQLLAISILVITARSIFTLDKVVLKVPLKWRVSGLSFSALIIVFGASVIFGWFPPNALLGWIFGLTSFASVFVVSFIITIKAKRKTTMYNEKLAAYRKEK